MSRRWAVLLAVVWPLALLAACGEGRPAAPATSLLPPGSPAPAATPIAPAEYARLLGRGMDVDWAKTAQGMAAYRAEDAVAFKRRGFSHVRIRVKADATPAFLQHLDRVIADCLRAGLIPVLAYQGDAFKANPTPENMAKVVQWWGTVARRYRQVSPLLSFDILIEVTGPLSRQPETLNALYEQVVAEIRRSNPTRIIFISPRARSDPERLSELRIPTQANGYLMAEWHFYAAGPSPTNPQKRWTTGTPAEKRLVEQKIAAALAWQRQTGLYTWVGAWMPGDYNHGNHYSVAQQVQFATFVACRLDAAHIPFAVNSDTKFYDREAHRWLPQMAPVVDAVLHPHCAP